VRAVNKVLVPEMDAGRRLLSAFSRHPSVFHGILATPRGWRAFVKLCRSEITFHEAAGRLPIRVALRALSRF
jgi:hypothetical protein